MPSTLIEIRRACSPEQETQLIEAVQAALVEGFKIPAEDRCVRLIVYGRGRSDLLELADVPLNSGVEVGDLLVTSGLGGRFPAGRTGG